MFSNSLLNQLSLISFSFSGQHWAATQRIWNVSKSIQVTPHRVVQVCVRKIYRKSFRKIFDTEFQRENPPALSWLSLSWQTCDSRCNIFEKISNNYTTKCLSSPRTHNWASLESYYWYWNLCRHHKLVLVMAEIESKITMREITLILDMP